MREGKIVLPVADNDGNTLYDLHIALALRLVRKFGGYTATSSVGGYRDQSEAVMVYSVAAEDTTANTDVLRRIARNFGLLCRQQAIYWVDFAGDVHIDDLHSDNDNVEK